MTTLKITLDTSTPALTSGAKQVNFALAEAINASLTTAQKRQRSHMAQAFTLRRKRFADLAVKITQFAKKGAPVGVIAMDPPGTASDDIFNKFEKGGRKRPKAGHSIAVPIVGSPVLKTKRSIVAEKNRPRTLLSGAQTTPSGKQVKRAKSFGGAFLRPAKDGNPGAIFVRTPRGLKLAYSLVPDEPIQPTLAFEDTITKSVRDTFAQDFEREFANALKTAKP